MADCYAVLPQVADDLVEVCPAATAEIRDYMSYIAQKAPVYPHQVAMTAVVIKRLGLVVAGLQCRRGRFAFLEKEEDLEDAKRKKEARARTSHAGHTGAKSDVGHARGARHVTIPSAVKADPKSLFAVLAGKYMGDANMKGLCWSCYSIGEVAKDHNMSNCPNTDKAEVKANVSR